MHVLSGRKDESSMSRARSPVRQVGSHGEIRLGQLLAEANMG